MILLALTLGCADVGELLDHSYDAYAAQGDEVCACWQGLGYASEDECLARYEVGQGQRDCVEEAFSQDREFAAEYLECLVSAREQQTGCLAQELECDDPQATIEPCEDAFAEVLNQCPTIPVDLRRAIELCG